MAIKYPVNTFADGDTVSPEEYVRELSSISSEMNGYVDRENLRVITPEPASRAKLALDAVNRVCLVGPMGVWPVEEPTVSVGAQFQDVPQVNKQMDCLSGLLELEAHLTWHCIKDDFSNKPRMQIAISVNNEIVACTMPEGLPKYLSGYEPGWSTVGNTDSQNSGTDTGYVDGMKMPVIAFTKIKMGTGTQHTLCMVPVTSGVCDIRLLYRIVFDLDNKPDYRKGMQTQIKQAGLWIRNMRR